MNNKIYLALLAAAALNLGACSEEKSIFDTSAAERLEAGRKQFTEALCADGGTWALEYFTNHNEPGYTFVCQFESDGSVVISGDHQWINNRFTSERSLWKVICDNGNVLTFNTFNNVFHILSTPEDVPGTPVNELGYGHEGDYEFMLMPRTGESIRLVGKKHGFTAWLHQLPAETDPEQYLGSIKEKTSVFSAKFPVLTLTDSEGETYSVSNLAAGVPVILSDLSTSPNSQTVSGNGIYTTTGFRFMEPLTVIRANDTTWDLTELTWEEDGSLVGRDDTSVIARITAPAATVNLGNSRYLWNLDKESMSPALKAAHDSANDALIAAKGKKRDLRDIQIGFQNNAGKIEFCLVTKVGNHVCRDFGTLTPNADNTAVTMTFTTPNDASQVYSSVAEYAAFKQMLQGEFTAENIGALNASTIILTSVSNPDVKCQFNVQ